LKRLKDNVFKTTTQKMTLLRTSKHSYILAMCCISDVIFVISSLQSGLHRFFYINEILRAAHENNIIELCIKMYTFIRRTIDKKTDSGYYRHHQQNTAVQQCRIC